MPSPLLPLPSLLPTTLIAVTIALATLALFVAALIICHTLWTFVVARRCGHVVVNAFSPATSHL
jgi:hypothetical protein